MNERHTIPAPVAELLLITEHMQHDYEGMFMYFCSLTRLQHAVFFLCSLSAFDKSLLCIL